MNVRLRSSVALVALASAAIWFAGLAGATLVLIELSGWIGGVDAVAVSIGIAAGATFFLAFCLTGAGRAESANPSEHGRLSVELESLRARLSVFCPGEEPVLADPAENGSPKTARAACQEACRQANQVALELGPGGPVGMSWFLQHGYTALWRRVHRANEALLQAAPKVELLRSASGDALRLQGSTIPNKDELLARIRVAAPAFGGLGGLTLGSSETSTGQATKMAPAAARAVLRDVREAINQFRDDARDGMIRARNTLMWTVLVTSFVAFGVLALAVAQGATDGALVAGVAFYLVGATVGLARQLRIAGSASRKAEEDYGFAIIRLACAPLLSGIVAVGGVVLTALVPVLVPDTNQGQAQAAADELPELSQIFSLSDNEIGLVVAAVFALAPGLLFKRLQAQAEKYTADLESTKAAQGANGAAGTEEA